MNRVEQIVAMGRRRMAIALLLGACGRGALAGAAVGLGAILAARVVWDASGGAWWWVVAATAAGAMAACLRTVGRVPTRLESAIEIDRRLGVQGRVASAWELGALGRRRSPGLSGGDRNGGDRGTSAVAELAQRQGEDASDLSRAAKVTPVRLEWMWGAWPAVAAAGIALAIWLPGMDLLGWGTRAGARVREAQAKEDVRAEIQAVVRNLRQATGEGGGARTDDSDSNDRERAAERVRELEALEAELARGEQSAARVAERAARSMHELANAAERRAAEGLGTEQEIGEKLRGAWDAVANPGEDGNAGGSGGDGAPAESALASALRRGDYDGAQRALRELGSRWDEKPAVGGRDASEPERAAGGEPPPRSTDGIATASDEASRVQEDRRRLAEELRKLAEELQAAERPAEQSAGEKAERASATDAQRGNDSASAGPEPKTPAVDEERRAQGEESSEAARRAVKELERAIRDVAKAAEDSAGERGTDRGKEQGGSEGSESSAGENSPKGQAASEEKGSPAAGGSSKKDGSTAREGSTTRASKSDNAGSTPSDPRSGSKNSPTPSTSASQGEGGQAGRAKSEPGDQQGDRAKESAVQQRGGESAKESAPESSDRGTTDRAGARRDPRGDGAKEPSGETVQTPAAGDTGSETRGGAKEQGAREGNAHNGGAGESKTDANDATRPGGQGSAERRPDAGAPQDQPDVKQSGEPSGSGTDAAPMGERSQPDSSAPRALEELSRKIEELREPARDAQRQQRLARDLRRDAERMMERANPEQRRAIEDQRDAERGEGAARGERTVADGEPGAEELAGSGTSGESPTSPRDGAGTGSGERRPGGRGVGQTGGQAQSSEAMTGRELSRGRGKPEWQTEDVDARAPRDPSTASKVAERDQVVAEWLGDGERPVKDGAGATAETDATARIREAAGRAEKAMEEGTVSSRYERVLRKYFDRLPRSIDAAKTGGSGAVPTAKDAE